jgi:hypothetical protein
VKEAESSNVLQWRSMKLWGSRVEEVTPLQNQVQLPSTVPEPLPGTGPKHMLTISSDIAHTDAYIVQLSYGSR